MIALSIKSFAVTVETTTSLNVYYPEYTKIDLVCGQMPKTSQKDVEFCCEAAFTGELIKEFKHSNIADKLPDGWCWRNVVWQGLWDMLPLPTPMCRR